MRPALVAAVLFAFAAPLPAQQTGTLRGRVTDVDGRKVALAHVAVQGTAVWTFTDSAGRYLLRGVPAGVRVITVTQLGYGDVQLTRTFEANAVVEADVLLQPSPLRGDTLVAAARAPQRTPQLEAFYERRERGNGYYFTDRDIERMQAQLFTDVLRRVPGIYLQAVEGPFGVSYVVQLRSATGASGGRLCPVLFFINGVPFPVTPDIGINNFVRPDDVAGVEVYSGVARLPPQFSSASQNARCGVVLIWTSAGRR